MNNQQVLSLAPFQPEQPITPVLDLGLDRLARAACRGDLDARNELFLLLKPKIDRICTDLCIRYAIYPHRMIEPAEVQDEAFLLFCDVVPGWDALQPFAAWFFGYFPWRMRTTIRSLLRCHAMPRTSAPRPPRHAQDTSVDVLPRNLRAEVDKLSQFERQLLQSRLDGSMTLREFASEHGLSVMTVLRKWRKIKSTLRQNLESSNAAGEP